MKSFLVFLFFLNVPIHAMHPLHVSVTEIEYDEQEKELEIMMRIFVEDLEKAIREETNQPELNLMNSEPVTRSHVSAYLKKHFTLSLDGKMQTLKYLGQELDGQALICYIQVVNVKKWKSIEFLNTTLINIYDDQSNLVHVSVKEKVKSVRLTTDNTKAKLSFD